jgi:hypothetical protein
MQPSVATYTEPAAWPDGLDARFFLWAAPQIVEWLTSAAD